uniref:BACK domain-containing protein n=1 Tax=Glossina austeni TaxID=7395 RepID=A0A1A9VB03_GLOAU
MRIFRFLKTTSVTDKLKIQYMQFIKGKVHRKKCSRLRKLADMHSCKELHNFSHKYLLDYIDDLIDEKDLLLLSFEENLNISYDARFSEKKQSTSSDYSLESKGTTTLAYHLSNTNQPNHLNVKEATVFNMNQLLKLTN